VHITLIHVKRVEIINLGGLSQLQFESKKKG
jgi:hypothetical protein